jgi:predicted DCC family thiol-disulfide oxidoreductase YuxK
MEAGIPTQLAPVGPSPTAPGPAESPSPVQAAPPRAGETVIFFDGVCGLCNRFIDFVISHDRAAIFHFAPLQGQTARERLPEADVRDVNTMVLWEEQGVLRKSTAAARILVRLGGVWRVIGTALLLVPRPLRDAGYSLVARYRYAIFGKKDSCRMPTPAERARFLP